MAELSSGARDHVKEIIGTELSDEEADALVATSAALSKAVQQLPRQELRQVDPPLRSIPGPRRP